MRQVPDPRYSGGREPAPTTTQGGAFVPYTFRPPTVTRRQATTDFLWSRVPYEEGQTVLKMTDGSYRTVSVVDPDLAGVAVTYLGGHVHTIDDAEASSLTAAGYGPFLEVVA